MHKNYCIFHLYYSIAQNIRGVCISNVNRDSRVVRNLNVEGQWNCHFLLALNSIRTKENVHIRSIIFWDVTQ
jgi:hypothetical protein